jgi:conjugative relaxase-like TrwC/TraI family protein
MTNVEGEWVALRARPLFNERYQLTEFYREALAHRVTDLGYAVREKADQVGWEIGGMPQEAIDNFSRRHFQIADKLLEWQKRMDGVQPTRIDEQNIARQTRVKKDLSLSPEEMRERHIQRLSPTERQSLRVLSERAHEYSQKIRLRMEVAYGEEHGQNHQLSYGERISL